MQLLCTRIRQMATVDLDHSTNKKVNETKRSVLTLDLCIVFVCVHNYWYLRSCNNKTLRVSLLLRRLRRPIVHSLVSRSLFFREGVCAELNGDWPVITVITAARSIRKATGQTDGDVGTVAIFYELGPTWIVVLQSRHRIAHHSWPSLVCCSQHSHELNWTRVLNACIPLGLFTLKSRTAGREQDFANWSSVGLERCRARHHWYTEIRQRSSCAFRLRMLRGAVSYVLLAEDFWIFLATTCQTMVDVRSVSPVLISGTHFLSISGNQHQ